ncbi:MAG: hypothetical protein H6937_09615 [Burkholderiales bacterium]|nr:hypothetical protein [Burkholderiales bacterium]MDR4517600.1 hypothetical protein [Nitrosomonas sp.]
MNRQLIHTRKHLFLISTLLLALLLNMPAHAANATTAVTSPKAGNYCPGESILLIVAEELSASLNLAMRSKAALITNDQSTAASELASVGTTLQLAASRGAAARSVMLIDAIIKARTGEDYAQMLTWFPLVHTSLQMLLEDAAGNAADDLISLAEDIMQGGRNGDPLVPLKEARHMLACDGLDIPLQNAIQAQSILLKQFSQGKSAKRDAYDTLLDSLRSALAYAMENRKQ